MIRPEAGDILHAEPHPLWVSRRLWSLWEIMQLFPASLFIQCISNIDRHYRLFSISPVPPWAAFFRIRKKDRRAFKFYSAFRDMCVDLELTASSASLQKMLDCLDDPKGRYGSFFRSGVEFAGRFKDEMEDRLVFALSLTEAEIVKNPIKGWEDVVRKFPSVQYDIEEASLCLALRHSTASVFHSIRSLEAAIRALSRCLEIPDPTKAADRNWGATLKTIKDKLDQRWPTSTTRLAGDGEFFDSSYAALAAMQNPWRNATMHLDQKYTEDEAKHLYEIIRGFMNRIALRCDENGEPKA